MTEIEFFGGKFLIWNNLVLKKMFDSQDMEVSIFESEVQTKE